MASDLIGRRVRWGYGEQAAGIVRDVHWNGHDVTLLVMRDDLSLVTVFEGSCRDQGVQADPWGEVVGYEWQDVGHGLELLPLTRGEAHRRREERGPPDVGEVVPFRCVPTPPDEPEAS